MGNVFSSKKKRAPHGGAEEEGDPVPPMVTLMPHHTKEEGHSQRYTQVTDSNSDFTPMYPRIVLFGDSITQFGFSVDRGGFVAHLADWFIRRADFINRGFSGYTTRNCLPLLPQIHNWADQKGLPALVVIFLGVNDACSDPAQAQFVPVEDYKRNLKQMVTFLEDKGIKRDGIVLVSPTPNNDKIKGRSTKAAKEYADACKSVAESLSGVHHVDLFNLFVKATPNYGEELFVDGLHFNPKGNMIFANALKPLVDSALQKKK
eukprot:Nk52_evm1s2577 gene=Nk52_evmTU1s2577